MTKMEELPETFLSFLLMKQDSWNNEALNVVLSAAQ